MSGSKDVSKLSSIYAVKRTGSEIEEEGVKRIATCSRFVLILNDRL